MPPQRTIIVNTERIMVTIAATAEQQQAAIRSRQQAEPLYWYAGRLEAELGSAAWVARDLESLAGKTLTPSERIRHQQALRKLESDGLIVLDTRHVRLTEAGLAVVKGFQN